MFLWVLRIENKSGALLAEQAARKAQNAHLHTCAHAHTHPRTHAHAHAHTHSRTRTNTHVCVCVCVCLCIVYICLRIKCIFTSLYERGALPSHQAARKTQKIAEQRRRRHLVCVCMYVCTCVCACIQREQRDRERDRERRKGGLEGRESVCARALERGRQCDYAPVRLRTYDTCFSYHVLLKRIPINNIYVLLKRQVRLEGLRSGEKVPLRVRGMLDHMYTPVVDDAELEVVMAGNVTVKACAVPAPEGAQEKEVGVPLALADHVLKLRMFLQVRL
jgi:hypothetical protein